MRTLRFWARLCGAARSGAISRRRSERRDARSRDGARLAARRRRRLGARRSGRAAGAGGRAARRRNAARQRAARRKRRSGASTLWRDDRRRAGLGACRLPFQRRRLRRPRRGLGRRVERAGAGLAARPDGDWRPNANGAHSPKRAARVSTSCGLPASTAPAATRSTSSGVAKRGGSSSRVRFSTASTSTMSRPSRSADRSRRTGRNLERRRRRAGAA